jgi:hypothetical protein
MPVISFRLLDEVLVVIGSERFFLWRDLDLFIHRIALCT